MFTAQEVFLASSIVLGCSLIVIAYFRIRIAILQHKLRKLDQ
jgi:hypothetical protein